MRDSIFTKIINGEIPAHKIYEDENVIAFLTIQPCTPGHTLVVPKQQVDHLWDLPEDQYLNLLSTTKRIANHIRNVTQKDRVLMYVAGFEVPHAHIHLAPVDAGQNVAIDAPDLDFAKNEELEAIANKLRLS